MSAVLSVISIVIISNVTHLSVKSIVILSNVILSIVVVSFVICNYKMKRFYNIGLTECPGLNVIKLFLPVIYRFSY